MRDATSDGEPICYFNGLRLKDCRRLFVGKRAVICDGCLGMCLDILDEADAEDLPTDRICWFCARPPPAGGRRIRGPNDVCICAECVVGFKQEYEALPPYPGR